MGKELFEKYPNPGALLRQLEGGRKAQAAKAQAQNQDQAPANGSLARSQRSTCSFPERTWNTTARVTCAGLVDSAIVFD